MTHIMHMLLVYYLAHTPMPDKTFVYCLKYLAAPSTIGEKYPDVENEVKYLLHDPEGGEK